MHANVSAVIATSLCALGVLQAPSPAATRTIIQNVNVVDVVAGTLVEGRDVVIKDDKIIAISPPGQTPTDDSTRLIDGTGRYLLPGLFDSHVHYASEDTFGRMLIAHGVTFVRDMGGPTAQILNLRDRLNRGEALGPEMIATGAIIDGDPPIWPFSEPVSTDEQARAAVRKLADAGANQIKLYSRLSPEAHLAAVDEAIAVGLKPVGHVPMGMRLDDAIAAGQVGFEHLDGFDEAIASAAGELVELPRSFLKGFSLWMLHPKADKAKLSALYKRMRDAKVVLCPTMVVMRGIGTSTDHDKNDVWLGYVPAYLKSFWTGENYAKAAEGARRTVPLMQQVVGELHKSGVTLLCGTDLANPYVFAGISLHEEMALFQDAGIPPADVLRSATITPAKFFGVADRLGTIDKGKTASLVLVSANPLADVRNALKIEGVFLRGKVYDKPAIAKLLDDAKAAAGASAPEPNKEAVVLELPGQPVHRGIYRNQFGQWDAGTETFAITKDEKGIHIRAQVAPKGGPTPPSIGTFHFDHDFKFREATWEQLTPGKPKTTYTVTGRKLVARHVEGDADPQVHEMELPESWLFGGPFYACEYASNQLVKLAAGETKTFKTVSFGYPGWRLVENDIAVTRHADRPLDDSAQSKALHYYTSSFNTPMGKFNGEAWVDDTGLSIKSVLKMPFGVVAAALDASP